MTDDRTSDLDRVGEELARATRRDLERQRRRRRLIASGVAVIGILLATIAVLPGERTSLTQAEAARVLIDIRAAVPRPHPKSITHWITDNRGWDESGRETWHGRSEHWSDGCAFRQRRLETRIEKSTVVANAEESWIGRRRQLYDPTSRTILTTGGRLARCDGPSPSVGLVSLHQELYRDGTRVVAREERDGRAIYRLENSRPVEGGGFIEVDATTFALVRSVQGMSEYRTPLWENLPPTAANRARFDLRRAHPTVPVIAVGWDEFERTRNLIMGSP